MITKLTPYKITPKRSSSEAYVLLKRTHITPAPSSPMLLGHFKEPKQKHTPDTNYPPHQPPLHFSTPLSPINHGPSSNSNIHMNEIYSIQQMYTLEDTILLPLNVNTPTNVSPHFNQNPQFCNEIRLVLGR